MRGFLCFLFCNSVAADCAFRPSSYPHAETDPIDVYGYANTDGSLVVATSPDDILPKRATPAAPDGYVPRNVTCPSPRPSIRAATRLSDEELAWLTTRRSAIQQPMRDLLNRINIPGVDVNAVTSNVSTLPVIAVALSGGGYRALLNGAGVIAAFDDRTPGSTDKGSLGGLLQSSTYVAGLSGGTWLLASIYVNNFTSISNLLNATPNNSHSVWQFQNSIFKGPDTGRFDSLDSAEYYTHIYNMVQGKRDAGFNTTITDYWGRALSYQLVNATDGGPGYTWSSIASDPGFSSGSIPMPIVVADSRAPGQLIISSNSTIFEFTPWELGSFDPNLYGFAPLKYVGSNFEGGTLGPDQRCVAGFDSVSYVLGSSSTLFNQFFLQVNNQTEVPLVLRDAIAQVLAVIDADDDDIAQWTPNPFYDYHTSSGFVQSRTKELTLVDGGEDIQNIPLHPLTQPLRNVDVVFAVDSSGDDLHGWPNGTSLLATYQRSLSSVQNGTGFPAIPDTATFVNLGLNQRPAWFGCDPHNVTSGRSPLIIYLPNAPYSEFSNVSTFDPDYTLSQRNRIVQNGYNMATMGNSTVDTSWSTCVGCAILLRHYQYNGLDVPETCQSCMSRFCWNGTLASTPNTVVGGPGPGLILGSQVNSSTSTGSAPTGVGSVSPKTSAAHTRVTRQISVLLLIAIVALATSSL